MAKRHWDAHGIQQGACNPRGITRSLLAAIEEAAKECPNTDSICKDAAVRQIAHQLAHVLRLNQYDCPNLGDLYHQEYELCRIKAEEWEREQETTAEELGLSTAMLQDDECAGGDAYEAHASELAQETDTDVKYPHVHVQLTGEDGNAYAIMGRVKRAMRRAEVPQAEISQYLKEAMSGDHDHLLQTTMKWVNWS